MHFRQASALQSHALTRRNQLQNTFILQGTTQHIPTTLEKLEKKERKATTWWGHPLISDQFCGWEPQAPLYEGGSSTASMTWMIELPARMLGTMTLARLPGVPPVMRTDPLLLFLMVTRAP